MRYEDRLQNSHIFSSLVGEWFFMRRKCIQFAIQFAKVSPVVTKRLKTVVFGENTVSYVSRKSFRNSDLTKYLELK